ncbi:uncharacterized protein SCHCODRAFT_02698332 [Schizophyllum commune H4-8]|nr:uncharacterized protein SCHCODRAFT_02698332 [Schizophyllum commune H4-8]KAI5897007.1 hypothetical protein SCHCODRAFT_02698332 [Schizophyllum commune H4-8]
MSILRRSPSLESVSSVRSLESMQSLDSAKSFSSAHSPGGESAKLSDYGDLNNIDMGRTITKAPVVPAVVDGDVEKPSPTDDGAQSTCDDECEPAPKSPVEPAPPDHRKHDRFYMDPRTIKLVLDDGTLYRVFRQSFATHSTLFAEEYLAGRGDDEVTKLPGVSSVDLDRFLSLMYPSEVATCELSSAQDWISILRLAHRWSFPTLRARALREIELVGSAVDKIATAREFGDLEPSKQWLMPAFVEACTTRSWLGSVSVQDAERLGAGTILALAKIREEMREVGGRKYDTENAIAAFGLATERPKTRTDPTVATTASTSPHARSLSAAKVTEGGPDVDTSVPVSDANPTASRPIAADEALKTHQSLFGGWAGTSGGNGTSGTHKGTDSMHDIGKGASSKSNGLQAVHTPILSSVTTTPDMPHQGVTAGPIQVPATAPPPVDLREHKEDDGNMSPLDRARLALSIAQSSEGESPKVMHSKRARASRIADKILNESPCSNYLKDQDFTLSPTVPPDQALRRVCQRIACLISRKLLIAHAPEQSNVDEQSIPTVLRVVVPKGVKGAPIKRRISAGLKGQGLTIREDVNNRRVLSVHVPQINSA